MKAEIILTCCGLTGVHGFPFDREFNQQDLDEGWPRRLAETATKACTKHGTAGTCVLNGLQKFMIQALKDRGWETVKLFQNPLDIHANEEKLTLLFYDTQAKNEGQWELLGDGTVHIKNPEHHKRLMEAK